MNHKKSEIDFTGQCENILWTDWLLFETDSEVQDDAPPTMRLMMVLPVFPFTFKWEMEGSCHQSDIAWHSSYHFHLTLACVWSEENE